MGRIATPTWSPDGNRIFFARLPPLDEDRDSAGIYYVTVMRRRELPVSAVVSTAILTAILVALLLSRQLTT